MFKSDVKIDEEDDHGSGFLAHAAASEALELRA